MLGVDQDGRVCIIGLKNTEATEDILPQALGYAIWAETNPDSIKAIWLENEDRPEDIQIDWDDMDVRVILVAPRFRSTVQRMASKIGYPVDLVQVRRYCLEDDEFLLVEVLEEGQWSKGGTTTAAENWDWQYYERQHGEKAVAQFRAVVDAIQNMVTARGWRLSYNLNKDYTGFKLGNKVVFSVAWSGTSAWKVKLKLDEGKGNSFRGHHWEFQRYDKAFSEAVFRPLQPESADIAELEPLFEEAYAHVSGAK
jgi:hypothetical protein